MLWPSEGRCGHGGLTTIAFCMQLFTAEHLVMSALAHGASGCWVCQPAEATVLRAAAVCLYISDDTESTVPVIVAIRGRLVTTQSEPFRESKS